VVALFCSPFLFYLGEQLAGPLTSGPVLSFPLLSFFENDDQLQVAVFPVLFASFLFAEQLANQPQPAPFPISMAAYLSSPLLFSPFLQPMID